MTTVACLNDVSRIYPGAEPTVALDRITLAVHAGETLTIAGPSGSGKSTLLGLLGLLDTPTSGTVSIEGVDVTHADDATRTRLRGDVIGFVFQQFHLIPHLSAGDNVEAALLHRGLTQVERLGRARNVLCRVGLSHRVHHRPGQLSGGEQQRVALARAIVTEPSLVLADEPTGNLDTPRSRDMLGLLASFATDGTAVVIVSHDPRVMDFTDRVVHLCDGRVIDGHGGTQ